MTISTTTSQAVYNGDNSTDTFSYPFRILEEGDLKVYVDADGSGFVLRTLNGAGTYDYTVTGVGNPTGGDVVFNNAPPAVTSGVLVLRVLDISQESDYVNGDGFDQEVIERDFDRVVMILQQLNLDLSRALLLPSVSDYSPLLPEPVPGMALFANEDGDGFEWNNSLVPVTAFSTTLVAANTALEARQILGVPEGGRGAGTSTPVEGLTDSNTAVGLNALVSNTNGYENTAVGVHALRLNTTGTENNAFGTLAMEKNTIGAENVAMGVRALYNNIDGNDNVAIGHAAMNYATSGDDNTAVGQTALYRLTTGDRNTAVGRQALEHLLIGTDNTAVGHAALANCTGSTNTAVGRVAGTGVTSGSGNTFLGYSAASSLQTGNFNCITGYQAMNVATAASNCAFFGYQAGYVSTGNNNTGVGTQAMLANTDGFDNTAVGILSLSANTTGDGNTAIGNLALSGNVTGNYNTAIGQAAFSSGSGYSNSSCLGYNAQVTGSNQVQLGDSSTTTYAYGAVQNRSDARDKSDVRDTVLGLDFINALRPVDFRWSYREQHGQKGVRFHHGLIAQEVLESGFNFGGVQDHKVNGGQDVLTIGYTELVAPLIKAVQELTSRVQELERQLREKA